MSPAADAHDESFAARLDVLVDAALVGMRRWTQQRAHGRFLLFCDPAATDPLDEALATYGYAKTPLVLQHPDVGPAAVPYLVLVDDEPRQERFVAHSVRLAITEAVSPVVNGKRSRSVCAWIHTSMSISDAARALGALSKVRVDGFVRLWRYWDPRVLDAASTPGSVAAAPTVPGGATWLFIDWLGRLQFLRPASTAGEMQPSIATITALNERNAVLQRVLHRSQIDSRLPEPQLAIAIALADSNGLSNPDDRVRFAADLMIHGSSIASSARLRDIVTQIRSGKGRYAAYTAEFDEHDWNAMAEEGRAHRQLLSRQVDT